MEIDRRGFPIEEPALLAAGFVPLELEFRPTTVVLPSGRACEWTTKGTVPSGPGLYAFTVEEDGTLAVLYVGLTEELWMITKGRTPDGKARPGQRYGRAKYAGVTRQRVNGLIAHHVEQGRKVRHWVRPLRNPPTDRATLRAELLQAETELIDRWNLRSTGWNRA